MKVFSWEEIRGHGEDLEFRLEFSEYLIMCMKNLQTLLENFD